MTNIVEGFEIPTFTPTGRYLLVPALQNILREVKALEEEEEVSLLDSDLDLSEKDFQTIVLATGDAVHDNIEVGDKVQIVPQGDWWMPLTIDDTEYFLIRDSVIVGIFK